MTTRLTLCLALLLLAGCPVTETRNADAEQPMKKSNPIASAVPDVLMQKIRADLAGRTGSTGGIAVQRAEAVVYDSGALGCPEPGQMYTQAQVDGYWVVLEQDGKSYDYRATGRGHFRLCRDGQPPGGHDSRM